MKIYQPNSPLHPEQGETDERRSRISAIQIINTQRISSGKGGVLAIEAAHPSRIIAGLTPPFFITIQETLAKRLKLMYSSLQIEEAAGCSILCVRPAHIKSACSNE